MYRLGGFINSMRSRGLSGHQMEVDMAAIETGEISLIEYFALHRLGKPSLNLQRSLMKEIPLRNHYLHARLDKKPIDMRPIFRRY